MANEEGALSVEHTLSLLERAQATLVIVERSYDLSSLETAS